MLLVLVSLILTIAYPQSSPSYIPAINFQTNRVTLPINNLTLVQPSLTQIVFATTFTEIPQIYLTMTGIGTIPTNGQTFTARQLIYSKSLTGFTHNLVFAAYNNGISLLSPSSYSFFSLSYISFACADHPYLIAFEVSYTFMTTTTSKNYQALAINYVSPLTPSHQYTLNTLLMGWSNLTAVNTPFIRVSANYINTTTYIGEGQTMNILVDKLQLLRIVIDKTLLITGINTVVVNMGSYSFFADPNIYFPQTAPYLFIKNSILLGIYNISSPSVGISSGSGSTIFSSPSPTYTVAFSYIIIMQQVCPSDMLYSPSTGLCYSPNAPYFYKDSNTSVAPCAVNCYTCTGPAANQCTSCLMSNNRVLSPSVNVTTVNGVTPEGSCGCTAGYVDLGVPACTTCGAYIAGCMTCTSTTHCVSCLSGCIYVSSSNCSCAYYPALSTPVCPDNFYFQPTQWACQCIPQTYQSPVDPSICLACDSTCLQCTQSQCLVCIGNYILNSGTPWLYIGVCMQVYNSTQLQGGSMLFQPLIDSGCAQWYNTSQCQFPCYGYYYSWQCYSACPAGSYPIVTTFRTCQPCRPSCLLCTSYSICQLCTEGYYYNSTVQSCLQCGANCAKCNQYGCQVCNVGYTLGGGQCYVAGQPPAILNKIPNNTGSISERTLSQWYLSMDNYWVDHSIYNGSCEGNCIYCIVPNVCGICSVSYFLSPIGKCLPCNTANHVHYSPFPVCKEICGDGITLIDSCDDMNTNSNDGCSQVCQIQIGWQCYSPSANTTTINSNTTATINSTHVQLSLLTLPRRSYCIAGDIIINAYRYFQSDRLKIEVSADNGLTDAIIQIQCTFPSQITNIQPQSSTQITIALAYYQQYIFTSLSPSPSCTISINYSPSLRIQLPIDPLPIEVNYNTLPSLMAFNPFSRTVTQLSIAITLFFCFLPFAPLSVFASLKNTVLIALMLQGGIAPILPYGLYGAMRMWAADWTTTQYATDRVVELREENISGVYMRVSLMFIIWLVWYQFIVRYLIKNKHMKHPIILRLFQTRHIMYHCIYTPYLSIILLYAYRLLSSHGHGYATYLMFAGQIIFLVAMQIHLYKHSTEMWQIKGMQAYGHLVAGFGEGIGAVLGATFGDGYFGGYLAISCLIGVRLVYYSRKTQKIVNRQDDEQHSHHSSQGQQAVSLLATPRAHTLTMLHQIFSFALLLIIALILLIINSAKVRSTQSQMIGGYIIVVCMILLMIANLVSVVVANIIAAWQIHKSISDQVQQKDYTRDGDSRGDIGLGFGIHDASNSGDITAQISLTDQ